MAFQDNKYLIISSPISLKRFKIKLKDLNSRFTSFIDIGINLPTDDLIRVILVKNFSDKQIQVSKKNIEYILKNIDRSYEKINLFSDSIDNLSLEKAKPISCKGRCLHGFQNQFKPGSKLVKKQLKTSSIQVQNQFKQFY